MFIEEYVKIYQEKLLILVQSSAVLPLMNYPYPIINLEKNLINFTNTVHSHRI